MNKTPPPPPVLHFTPRLYKGFDPKGSLFDHGWFMHRSGLSGVKYPKVLASTLAVFIGIDPGIRNFGVAVISGHHFDVYQAQLKADSRMPTRVRNLQMLLRDIFDNALSNGASVWGAAVENAAHSAPYGQVQLAEHRTICVTSLPHFDDIYPTWITLPSPASWRKSVFGHGRIYAETVWPELEARTPDGTKHFDGATALALAYHAYLVSNPEKP